MSVKSVRLEYTAGTSDKIYIIEKNASGTGFTVDFAFGKRGQTFRTGTKTVQAVSDAEADRIFDNLKLSKTKKGYVAVSSSSHSASAVQTVADKVQTGISVQLLNPIEKTQLDLIFADKNFGMQEKFDGKRIVMVLDGEDCYGVNRTGFKCPVPQSHLDGVRQIREKSEQVFGVKINKMVLDGESIGDEYIVFDLLELNETDFRGKDYLARYNRLTTLIRQSSLASTIPFVEAAALVTGEKEKRMFAAEIEAANSEGFVFKNLSAPYQAGRPNSGGDQLKFKICASATCRVSGQNGTKRSISLEVIDDRGRLIPIGNCTVPVNCDIPPIGAFVEIRYLYAYRNGSLFQPVYQGRRDDKTAPDNYDTLKFKADDAQGASAAAASGMMTIAAVKKVNNKLGEIRRNYEKRGNRINTEQFGFKIRQSRKYSHGSRKTA